MKYTGGVVDSVKRNSFVLSKTQQQANLEHITEKFNATVPADLRRVVMLFQHKKHGSFYIKLPGHRTIQVFSMPIKCNDDPLHFRVQISRSEARVTRTLAEALVMADDNLREDLLGVTHWSLWRRVRWIWKFIFGPSL